MKEIVTFAATLLLASFVLGAARAQVEKTFQRTTMNGRTVQTPYLTYEEFRSVTVCVPEGEIPLQKLLTISSVEEATRLLGEPKKIERNEFLDTDSFDGWVHYEGGTTLEYYGFPDGTSRLTTMELRSPEWSLTIGETELSPGVEGAELSSTVRKSTRPGSSLKTSGIDGTGTIYIAESSTSKKGPPELPEGVKSHISVHLNRTKGIVRVVRLSHIPNQDP